MILSLLLLFRPENTAQCRTAASSARPETFWICTAQNFNRCRLEQQYLATGEVRALGQPSLARVCRSGVPQLLPPGQAAQLGEPRSLPARPEPAAGVLRLWILPHSPGASVSHRKAGCPALPGRMALPVSGKKPHQRNPGPAGIALGCPSISSQPGHGHTGQGSCPLSSVPCSGSHGCLRRSSEKSRLQPGLQLSLYHSR